MKIFHSEYISEFFEIFFNKHPVILIISHRPPSHGKPWKGPDHGINQPKSNVDLRINSFDRNGCLIFENVVRIFHFIQEDYENFERGWNVALKVSLRFNIHPAPAKVHSV